MKNILIVLFLFLNIELCLPQLIKQELSLPFSNSSFNNLCFIDDTGFAIFEQEVYITENLCTSFGKFNSPQLKENEYFKDILKFNSKIFLLTSQSLYEYIDIYSDYVKIPLPFEEFFNLESETRKPDYELIILNDNLYLKVDFYHGVKEIYYYDSFIKTFLKYDIKREIYYSEYDENFSIISPNEYYIVKKNIPPKYSEFVDGNYSLNYQLDSIFYVSNLENIWRFLKCFRTDGSQTETELRFCNSNFGYYYSINNQFYELHASCYSLHSTRNSTIDFYITKNGGIDWIKSQGMEYNGINYVKFFNDKNGIIICSQVSKEGIYEKSEEGYKYLINIGNYPQYKFYLLNTTDGGQIWRKKIDLSFIKEEYDLNPQIINDKFIWLLIGRKLYISNNNGNEWKEIEDFNFLKINNELKLYCFKDNIAYIVLNEKIFRYSEKELFTDKKYSEIEKSKYNEAYEIKEREKYEREIYYEKLNEAEKYFKEKKYKLALQIYLEIINSYPRFEVYFNTAYCCSELKEYDDAIYYYEKFIEKNPYSSSALNNLGVVYENIGKFELALEYYQKALDIEDKELYANNIENVKKFLYKITDIDNSILKKYFPSHNNGSKLLYWQSNNTASYMEENYLENIENIYANISINYFKNYSAYQVNEILLTEKGNYLIKKNKLEYNGKNKMLGEYSIDRVAFPLKNSSWVVFGIQFKFLGYEDRVITSAGTFYNCLVLGTEYYKEYYAPNIGLILVRSAIMQSYFITERELIDYLIK